MISLGTMVAAVKLVDRLLNHGGIYSGRTRDERLNQREGRGNREKDICKVKLTGLGEAESGDNSKISNGILLIGTGNRIVGKVRRS